MCVWNGFIRPKIWSQVGLTVMNFRIPLKVGISWMARRPLASTERCCSTELVLLQSFPDRDFFLTWPISTGPTLLGVFIRLSKGYCHCECLSSSSHRLFNLTDMRRTTQRWQSVGRSIPPALIGQARKKNTLYISVPFMVRQTDFTVTQHFSLSGCAGKSQVLGDSKQLMNLNLSVATLSISLVLQHSETLQHLTRSLYVLPRAQEEAQHVLREVLTTLFGCFTRGREYE